MASFNDHNFYFVPFWVNRVSIYLVHPEPFFSLFLSLGLLYTHGPADGCSWVMTPVRMNGPYPPALWAGVVSCNSWPRIAGRPLGNRLFQASILAPASALSLSGPIVPVSDTRRFAAPLMSDNDGRAFYSWVLLIECFFIGFPFKRSFWSDLPLVFNFTPEETLSAPVATREARGDEWAFPGNEA